MPHVTRKKNGHLIEITRDDGIKDVRWDWDQLLADVKAAIAVYEDKHVHVEEKPKKSATKKTASKNDLVKETEEKVTKSRAKSTSAKKPTAKKPTAKKPAAKKK